MMAARPEALALATVMPLAISASLAGVLALRLAWRRPWPIWTRLPGWAAIAAAPSGWALLGGADWALAQAILATCLAGLAVLAAGASYRVSRPARRPAAGQRRNTPGRVTVGRALLRTLCGGPLAGLCAGLLCAVWMRRIPGAETDRLAGALLLAPALWSAGLVWAMTDSRPWRAGGGLAALGLAAFLLCLGRP